MQLLAALLLAPTAAPHPWPQDYRPVVAEASREGEQAIAAFRLADGFRISLWAAEPLLANPVAFAFDRAGRCFVAETFRLHAGVTDMRNHMDWLDDDLASRTVEDRVAMMRRHTGGDFASYEKEHDRVRRLIDSDGDGRAESATVFADGFHQAASGIGAGLLCRDDSVYYTCIPDLWRLEDADADGVAESRSALSSGYGVHIALLGHDMHGLCLGPDGRLYFSIGDRGLSLRTKEGRLLEYPDTGCVLRCDPDGSNLEVFASGLRNPQELVFDDYGNLFTGDNNSDGGDRARFVWLLEGSDSGWRYPYQWIEGADVRGPWNAERLWHPSHPGQPAYIVPPIENLGDGPSGLTYSPSDAWGEGWSRTFFLCDFRGTPGLSGIHSFQLERQGAGFRLVGRQSFLWGVLATDVDFGPDGALYLSDWVDGWNQTGKGRIYRVEPVDEATRAARAEAAELIRSGMQGRDAPELAQLLAHPDRRVRLAAQYELVRHATIKDDVDRELFRGHLLDAAVLGQDLLQRLHGIWGLGQVARTDSKAPAMVFRLIDDPEPEVRAATLAVLGPGKHAFSAVAAKTLDPDPRVRLAAAQALGYFANLHAVEPLVKLLGENADQDAYIRHACVRALERLNQRGTLLQFAADESPAVRRGILLVLRRWKDAEVARYLADPDPSIVAEAARAIYDLPIEAALPALAEALAHTGAEREPYCLRRMLHANERAGAAGAARIAEWWNRREGGASVRAEALDVLAHWSRERRRDAVIGAARAPWTPGPIEDVRPLAGSLAAVVFASGETTSIAAWIRLIEAVGDREQCDKLRDLFGERRFEPGLRRLALGALLALAPDESGELLQRAALDPQPSVRELAFEQACSMPEAEALAFLDRALADADLGVRRSAIRTLGQVQGAGATQRLRAALAEEAAGRLPAALALDLWESGSARGGELAQAIEAWRGRLAAAPLGELALCLEGGDAQAGRAVFFENAAVSCLRCHRIGDSGGTEAVGQVGPDLSQVGGRLDRTALLESVLHPNAQLAEGYERWILVLDDGSVSAGTILSEEQGSVHLLTPGQEDLMVPVASIVERRRDLSAMPEGLAEKLSRRALRDLIEFLSSQR